nr:unnamed protein product [Callosobruchus chinensis]
MANKSEKTDNTMEEKEDKDKKESFGLHLDLLMDSMEETRFKKKYSELIERLVQETHFNDIEVESLLIIYYKLAKENTKSDKYKEKFMTKEQFRDFLHCALDMTDDSLMDRIFVSLDRMPGSTITMETYTQALSLMLRGTLEEKINFCFRVYDTMGDGLLGREAMFYLLRNSLVSLSGEDDAEESVKDMIEVITKKLDIDRDGKISFQDYKQTVLKQPALLEVFGQCLPSRGAVYTFSMTFTTNPALKIKMSKDRPSDSRTADEQQYKEPKSKRAKADFGLHLDLLMDSMEETRFRKKHMDLVEKLADESHFTSGEVDSLLLIYYKMSKENINTKIKGGLVTKEQFRDFLHSALDMTDDSLMDRIFLSLDRMPGKTISMETFIHALSLFLRGTLEEKINHCFNVYDSMGDGLIARESMFYLLKNSLVSLSGEDDAEESVKDMIEVITKKLDIDRDGKISFQDYKQTVLKNPMLLEVFGQCLPDRRSIYTFSSTFSPNTGLKM